MPQAANPFDQFDEATTSAATAEANPFDQFDAAPPAPKPSFGERAVDAIRSTLGATAQEGVARGNSARQIALTQGTQTMPEQEPNPVIKRLVDERLGLSPNMDTLRTQGFAAASREARNDQAARDSRANTELGAITPAGSRGNVLSGTATGVKTDAQKAFASMIQAGARWTAEEAIGNPALQEQAKRLDETMGEMYRRADKAQTAVDPIFSEDQWVQSGVHSGVRSLAQLGTNLLASGGNPIAALGLMAGKDVGLPAVGEALNDYGKSSGEALAHGAIQGAIEYATEKVPLGFLVSKFGKVPVASFVTGYLGRELPQEAMAQIGQSLEETITLHPETTMREWAATLPEQMRDVAVATLTMTGVMGGAGHITKKTGDYLDRRDADAAARSASQAWQTRGLSPTANGIIPPQSAASNGGVNERTQAEPIARAAEGDGSGAAVGVGGADGGVPVGVAGREPGPAHPVRPGAELHTGQQQAGDVRNADGADDSLNNLTADDLAAITGEPPKTVSAPARERIAEIDKRTAQIDAVREATPDGPNRMILDAERTVLDMERHDLLTAPQPASADVMQLPMNELLPLAKSGNAEAARELKRRETEWMWSQRDQEKADQTAQIRTDALAQQAEAAPAVTDAAGFDAPTKTALADALERAQARARAKEAVPPAVTVSAVDPDSTVSPQQTPVPKEVADEAVQEQEAGQAQQEVATVPPAAGTPAAPPAQAGGTPSEAPPAQRQVKPRPGTPPTQRLLEHADSLQAMAQDAGWSEEGGKLIRQPDGKVERTKWVPRAEWFRAGMIGDPAQVQAAVGKATRGEFLNAKERRTLDGMMEYLDAQQHSTPLDEDSSAADFERLGYDDLAQPAQEVFSEADDFDALGSRMSPAEAMAALGFTEDEINAETKSAESVAAGTGTTGSASREDSEVVAGGQKASRESDLETAGTQSEAGDGRQVKVGPTAKDPDAAYKAKQAEKKAAEKPAPLLDAYTAEDLRKREDAARAAADEEAKKAKAADDKARADAERDSFTLTGSDRAADVAMAHGQGGLFDLQSKAEPEKTAAPKPEEAAKIADVGEELFANRRNFTGRGIKWDDVSGLNDTLKVKEVTKAKVWPRPNYETLVSEGMNRIVARMVKQVYDGISAGPDLRSAPTDEDLQRYIDVITRIRETIFAVANDRAAISEFAAAAAAEIERGTGQRAHVSLIDLARDQKSAAVIQKILTDRLWPESKGQSGLRPFARGTDAYKDITVVGGDKALHALQFTSDDFKKWATEFSKGWPGKREAWEVQGYRVLGPDEYTVSEPFPVQRFDKDAGRSVPTGEFNYRVAPRTGRGSWGRVGEPIAAGKHLLVLDHGSFIGQFDTRDAAVEAARDRVKRKQGDGRDMRGMNISDSERSGPAHRAEGDDVTPQRLMESFGFRGVNFGNEAWINQAERQAFLNHAYDGLLDLAEILGVPPKAMSLNGELGIAFGAQGKGGSAAAHFVPGVNEINLTKTMGAGTLAHEWGHALDHWFGRLAGFGKDAAPMLSEHAYKRDSSQRIELVDGKRVSRDVPTFAPEIRPEIVKAFRAIYEAMERRSESVGERATRMQGARAKAVRYVDGWLARARAELERSNVANRNDLLTEFDQQAERIRKADLGDGYARAGNKAYSQPVAAIRLLHKEATGHVWSAEDTDALEANARHLQHLMAADTAEKSHQPQITTDFKSESLRKDKDKGGKKYWATPTEMFARAFETYVHAKLVERGRSNTFLTDADQRAQATKTVADNSSAFSRGAGATREEFAYPYPRGEERTALVSAFDKLLATVEAREQGGKVALLSRSGTGSGGARALHAFDDHDGWRENLDVALKQIESPPGLQYFTVHAFGGDGLQRIGFLVMNGEELRNIQIDPDSQRKGIGEAVVRSLLASMPEGATLKVSRIEPDAIGFWKKLGTQFDNISSDPAVDMDGRLTWGDYESARPEQATAIGAAGHDDAGAASLRGQDDRGLREEGSGESSEGQGQLDRAAEGLARGVSSREIRAAVAPLVDGARNLPTIHYLDAPRDAPRDVQKWLREQGAFFDAKGLAWGDSDVFLFGRYIRDADDARFTALHELTHYGLAGRFGRDLDAVLLRMDESNPRLRAAANAKRQAYPNLTRMESINEALADMAGRGEAAKLNGFKKLVAVIRDWLRRHGFVREFTDNDVLQIIAKSADYWRRKRTSEYGAVLRGKPMTNREATRPHVNAAVGTSLGELSKHPDYEAAKAGDVLAAARVADDLVTQAMADQVKKLAGDGPLVLLPVVSIEQSGRNMIPIAVAERLESMIGNATVSVDVVQGNSPKRTAMTGLDRIFARPEFEGDVTPSARYVIIDDTLTQGGTFASATNYIRSQGGEVAGAFALTGKQYSSTLKLSPETLARLREKHGDLEEQFSAATGYGFDSLTESEARYLASFEPSAAVRDRIVEAGRQVGADATSGTSEVDGKPVTPDTKSRGMLSRSTEERFGTLTPAQEKSLEAVGAIGNKKPGMSLPERSEFIRGTVDQFHPLKELDPQAYQIARMSKAADGTLEALMLYGKPFMRGNVPDVKIGDGGFAKVLASLQGEHDRFLWWVAAQRAEYLKAAGLENLFEVADIQNLKTLNAGVMADGKQRQAIYHNALVKLNEYNDAVLEVAEKSGLIDAKARALFKGMPYVPFYRVMDEDREVKGPRTGAALTEQRAWKKIKGGTSKINEDLLANMLMNWGHLYDAAAKNRAAIASIDAMLGAGVAAPANPFTKDAVSLLRNGVREWYSIDDKPLLQAVQALEYMMPKNWITSALRGAKHVATMTITANPAFKVRNLMRDSIAAVAQSGLSPNIAKNVWQGWRATAKDSQTYASMLAGGGIIRFGSMVEGDRAKHAHKIIEREGGVVLNPSTWHKLSRMAGDVLNAYNELGDRSENANRAALYEQMIAKGYSHEDAAFAARDLLDFSMRGAWSGVRWFTEFVPFTNARMQGLYKLGRAGLENPARMLAAVSGVAAFSLMLWAMYHDDPDWQKREEWDRDTYWWFKIGERAYRIPKPFEVGSIGTLAERTAEAMFDDEGNGRRWIESIGRTLSSTFALNPIPQLIKPMVDLYANKDSFTGRPIESAAMENMVPSERYSESTTLPARWLSGVIPNPGVLMMQGKYETLSPAQIDFLARGYFGWVGSTAMRAADYVAQAAATEGERPDMKLRDYFLVGNFAETLPSSQSRYLTELYTQGKEYAEILATYRQKVEREGDDAADAWLQKNGGDDALEKGAAAGALTKEVSAINAEMREVKADTTLSGEEKRRRLDELEQERNDVAEAAVKDLR